MRILIPTLGLVLAGALVGQPARAQDHVETVADSVIYQGTFHSVAGHEAGGGYQVLRRDGRWVIRLMESFASEKVPDGHVYLSNQAESLAALVDEQWIEMRVPYPLGFFAKGMDGRIDDPNIGWKGKGLWSTWANRAAAHNEGGKGQTSKVVHFQLRPNPIAK